MTEGPMTGVRQHASGGHRRGVGRRWIRGRAPGRRGGAGVIYMRLRNGARAQRRDQGVPSHIDEEGRERFCARAMRWEPLGASEHRQHLARGRDRNGRPYIVMPYMASDSLAVRLRREGPIAWPEALRIAVKLCGALETAHRSGTLHRDIKPANVLVSDYGEPQFSDSGSPTSKADTRLRPDSSPAQSITPRQRSWPVSPATVASDIY